MTTDPLTVRVVDRRPPLTTPLMSNAVDRHERVRLTSRHIEIGGRAGIPVSGELHYSRVPRGRWDEELRLLVSSGITMVSTYVFWIHHEPVRGQVDFTGGLDLAEFLDAADRVGLDVVLRVGPWAHGEARNGGLPDWVLEEAPRARTDDAGYLALVTDWFGEIGARAAKHCGPTGRIVGIQIENELYDQPGHIVTLKRLAREAGLSAPLWTATAWGGAELPPHDVFPLYSGYADGFWADQGSTWDDSFRDHFRFTDVWDDPGVGGDQRDSGVDIVVRELDPEFAPATCELGGGMATAYHRRPLARAADIAAVANVKLGNGSLWQGFYMFAGGTNPADDLQESQSTEYPNDLPRFDYDFQAAIGSTGRLGDNHAALREHNAFVAGFGERLAGMFSSLPSSAPVEVHDLDTVRWAVRTDERGGFLFINTHQPHEPLSGATSVQFRVEFTASDALTVPDRPVDIAGGVVARWPLRLDIGGALIEWATASVMGRVTDAEGADTLVLRAHEGIDVRIAFGAGARGRIDGVATSFDEPVDVMPGSVVTVGDALRVLVVADDLARSLWFIGDELIVSGDAVWLEGGAPVVRASAKPTVSRWNGERFEPIELEAESTDAVDGDAVDGDAGPGDTAPGVEQVRDARTPPRRYGERGGRSSAPTRAQFDDVAAVWRIDAHDHSGAPSGPATTPTDTTERRIEMLIEWEGDVAQLRADGRLIADRFWDGREWYVDVTDVASAAELTLHVAPLTSESVVDLDAVAQERVDAAGTLCAVTRVRRIVTTRWVAA